MCFLTPFDAQTKLNSFVVEALDIFSEFHNRDYYRVFLERNKRQPITGLEEKWVQNWNNSKKAQHLEPVHWSLKGKMFHWVRFCSQLNAWVELELKFAQRAILMNDKFVDGLLVLFLPHGSLSSVRQTDCQGTKLLCWIRLITWISVNFKFMEKVASVFSQSIKSVDRLVYWINFTLLSSIPSRNCRDFLHVAGMHAG